MGSWIAQWMHIKENKTAVVCCRSKNKLVSINGNSFKNNQNINPMRLCVNNLTDTAGKSHLKLPIFANCIKNLEKSILRNAFFT